MRRTTRVKLVCESCGLGFERLPCQIKISKGVNSRGKFCSKKCMENKRKHGSYLRCSKCGKKFYRRYGEQGKSKKQYCSKECYFSDRPLKMTTYKKISSKHEHRTIVEKHIGRQLKRYEIIHHIDGNRHNNKIENLALLTSKQHGLIHKGIIKDINKFKVNNYGL